MTAIIVIVAIIFALCGIYKFMNEITGVSEKERNQKEIEERFKSAAEQMRNTKFFKDVYSAIRKNVIKDCSNVIASKINAKYVETGLMTKPSVAEINLFNCSDCFNVSTSSIDGIYSSYKVLVRYKDIGHPDITPYQAKALLYALDGYGCERVGSHLLVSKEYWAKDIQREIDRICAQKGIK